MKDKYLVRGTLAAFLILLGVFLFFSLSLCHGAQRNKLIQVRFGDEASVSTPDATNENRVLSEVKLLFSSALPHLNPE